MTITKMMEVLKMGDSKGSALKELAKFYHCDDYDLSPINDKMVDSWIAHLEYGDDERYEYGD